MVVMFMLMVAVALPMCAHLVLELLRLFVGGQAAAPTLKPTNLRLHRGENERAGNTCDERSIH
jgi:hypothetical protein